MARLSPNDLQSPISDSAAVTLRFADQAGAHTQLSGPARASHAQSNTAREIPLSTRLAAEGAVPALNDPWS